MCVQAVQSHLDTAGHLDGCERQFSAHAVAELLLRWLECLPAPVIPAGMLANFVGCGDLGWQKQNF